MRFLQLLKIGILTLLGSALLFNSDSPAFSFLCDAPTHEDYAPLMAFYNSTDGPNWNTNTGWGVDCDVCGWYGVGCNAGRVVSIFLGSNQLSGNLPLTLNELTELRTIQLFSNQLTGGIPETLFEMESIEVIVLNNNPFNSPLPAVISGAPNLRIFRCSSCDLTGEIPTFGSDLNNFEEISLGFNQLVGTIPSSLTNLPSLKALILARNQLTGEIPVDIGLIVSLERLDLSYNSLTGGLPTSIMQLVNLTSLVITRNPLDAQIPPGIGALSQLRFIFASDAGLTGSLPDDFSDLSNLVTLRLEDNNLTGVLPEGFEQLINLRTLYLDGGSNLTGVLPTNIGQMTSLYDVRLSNNSFEGPLPESIGELINLRYLFLEDNDLTGTLPQTLGGLESLQDLRLNGNFIEGNIPEELSSINPLVTLNISNNLLEGNFPSSLGGMPNLSSLSLHSNRLEGCIPESYEALCSSNKISLYNNCTFENPSFSEFCSSAECNNSLNLSAPAIEVCAGETFTIESPSGYAGYEWSVTNAIERILSTEATISQYYYVTITNSRGCTKSDSIFIEVLSNESGMEIGEICPGSFIEINGTIYDQTGEYTQTIPRPGSCDSTVIVTITEEAGTTGTYSETICPGTTTVINGVAFGPGSASQTIQNQAGCDSVIAIMIAAYPEYNENLEFSVCEGQTYNYEGQDLAAGPHTIPLATVNGCDSTINVLVLENQADQVILSEIICLGQTYQVGNQSFESTGTYAVPLTNQSGCDSTVTLNLTVISGEDQTINASICEGEFYPFAGVNYSENTSIQDSVIIAGCKSLTTLNLTVLQPVTFEFNKTACKGEIEYFFGQFLYEAGTYEHKLNSSQNCDSTIIMHLDFAPQLEVNIDTFLCAGTSLFFDGQFYDEPGTIQISGNSSAGCDSTTYLNIDLYEKDKDYFQEVVCNSDSILFDGEYYSAGQHIGTYYDGNCTVEFELTIAEVARISSNEVLTFCAGSSVDFMNNTYHQGGQYYLGQDLSDCETLENLFVLEGSTEEVTTPQIFCIGTPLTLNGTVISESGTYPITSEMDCIEEFVNVLFISGDEVSIEHTLQEGESYQLHNISYDQVGVYEVVVGDEYGCPTLIILEIKVQSCGGVRQEEATICDGESIVFFDDEISETGQYEYRKSLEIGCDSIIRLLVNVIEEVNFEISGPRFICEGEEVQLSGPEGYDFLWSTGLETNEISISEGGPYELTIFDQNNCASFQSIEIEEISFPTEDIDIHVNDPQTCTATDGGILVDLGNEEDYIYSIDGGSSFQESNEFSDLANGTYEIVLSDLGQRCFKTLSSLVVLESSGVPQIQNIDIKEINDCLGQLGSITIIPQNPDESYIYSIDEGVTWSTSPIFDELEEGSYTVQMKVEDSECVNNLSSKIDLENIGKLTAEISILSNVSCAEANDGKAMIEVAEGQSPYVIEWSDGQTGIGANNLASGKYQVTVTDANGCIESFEVALEAPEIAALLDVFQDTILCADESLTYDVDANFNYVIFRNEILYYSGKQPVISDVGIYQVITENGADCVADRYFEVATVDLSELGIDFLLSTEGVQGVEVVAVNVSDPMPEDFEWQYDGENIDVTGIDGFAQGLIFRDTGTYKISLFTDVDGCLASIDKTIVIYADSSYLGTYEEPEPPIDFERFGSWEVFPNPNNGQFDVEVEVSGRWIELSLSVYDIYGALLGSRQMDGSLQYLESFNLANAGTGVYTVVLSAVGKQFYKNILIVK